MTKPYRVCARARARARAGIRVSLCWVCLCIMNFRVFVRACARMHFLRCMYAIYDRLVHIHFTVFRASASKKVERFVDKTYQNDFMKAIHRLR